MQLLRPNNPLKAIAVEGLSPRDPATATVKTIEIADLTLYCGQADFALASRVTISQVKYSIANEDIAFRTPRRPSRSLQTATGAIDASTARLPSKACSAKSLPVSAGSMLLCRRGCSELPESGEEQLENRRTVGLAVTDREIDGRRCALQRPADDGPGQQISRIGGHER